MKTPSTSESDPFAVLKQGVRWMWSLGDYTALARILEPPAERLASELDVRPGIALLDVAAGNGNFAIAAARHGAEVTASDLTPAMVALGRRRTRDEGLEIAWLEADVESLPFDDDRFDVVASVFGAMFAPRPDRVAREMFRVARPGGVVAMANYSDGGFLGGFASLMARHSRPSPFKLPSPFEWGDEAELRRRLEPFSASIEVSAGELSFEFASVDVGLAFWERTNPPHIALRSTLDSNQYATFMKEAAELMEALNASSSGLVLKSPYVTVVAQKKI
ncbi:MAG TPA: class I SAM-dependent methyltransferase [Candidatus Dormibacteraeota bacterium]|nr:class I SAM-dependent methyltransferase [Candidatus Dormibacteraeota bacterium]